MQQNWALHYHLIGTDTFYIRPRMYIIPPPLKGHVSHIKLSIDYSICRLIVLILLLLLLMYVITMVLHV